MQNDDRAELTMKPVGSRPFIAPGLAALLLATTLGACHTDQAATGSIGAAPDYRRRHPIVLAEAPRSIDIFVGGTFNGLDERQRGEVHDFAGEYLSAGKGTMTILVPEGVRFARNAEQTLRALRHVLVESGVPPRAIVVKTYRPQDPALASPIRMRFERLQAKVASQCGQWPDDLGAIASAKDGWDNHAYWNLGCAYQANLAAQVADPVDLVRARQESPADTVQRMNRIDKVRKGEDPTTSYKVDATQINQTVGN